MGVLARRGLADRRDRVAGHLPHRLEIEATLGECLERNLLHGFLDATALRDRFVDLLIYSLVHEHFLSIDVITRNG
jgi:hypothetical protein